MSSDIKHSCQTLMTIRLSSYCEIFGHFGWENNMEISNVLVFVILGLFSKHMVLLLIYHFRYFIVFVFEAFFSYSFVNVVLLLWCKFIIQYNRYNTYKTNEIKCYFSYPLPLSTSFKPILYLFSFILSFKSLLLDGRDDSLSN